MFKSRALLKWQWESWKIFITMDICWFELPSINFPFLICTLISIWGISFSLLHKFCCVCNHISLLPLPRGWISDNNKANWMLPSWNLKLEGNYKKNMKYVWVYSVSLSPASTFFFYKSISISILATSSPAKSCLDSCQFLNLAFQWFLWINIIFPINFTFPALARFSFFCL